MTGFVISAWMYSAAFSSSAPPISPTMTTISVSSSASNLESTSMKPDPTTGSPPMPTMVELLRERPGPADEADPALAEDLGRDDADVRLPRRQRAGAVRPEHRDALRADVVVDPQHLVGREPLSDADHGLDARVDRLVDGVGREAGRNEDHRRVRASLARRLGHGVEHRDALDLTSAFPGRDAGDDVRPVVAVADTVERAFPAGQPLDDELGVVVDDDRH